ncbi:hypothetical protein H9L25_00615 [Terrisporobacter mayombei]|nr:hypothetical protein [Terrisporobacter mayombei]
MTKYKLYQVSVLDDMDEIFYLTVSDKTIKELQFEIENDDSYSCFIHCSIQEVNSVDGHKILVV